MQELTRDEFEAQLAVAVAAMRQHFEEGKREIALTWRRSMVAITKTGDTCRRYAPGPTLEFKFVMREPNASHAEMWNSAPVEITPAVKP